jgi:hypothetical protein
VIDGVRFVPISKAQKYVKQLASELSALDGSPVYFCDDGSSGTSSAIVDDTETKAEEDSSLDGTPILALLNLCDRSGAVLRVWWAGGDSDAYRNVTECKTIAEATDLIVGQAFRSWVLRYAP